MNKKYGAFLIIVLGGFLFLSGFDHLVKAQEEQEVIANEKIFGKLQRPSVSFPHDRHMDALEKVGCGACHHIFDKKTKALVPTDGEGATCSECHGLKKEDNTPGLREAYHGSCTVCHRKLSGQKNKIGPVTCGECHKK